MIRFNTNEILMIRPANFGYNPETAETNAFQQQDEVEARGRIALQARSEFDQMVKLLQEQGVVVHVIEDNQDPIKPDAIFPNNWITFHQDGRIVTYPMQAASRRREIRSDILLKAQNEWAFRHVVRLDKKALNGTFLEGTGSLILDRPSKTAFACISPRTDIELLNQWCALMGYKSVAFRATDAQGQEIYHTNVMMALGHNYAVICLEAIPDGKERNVVEKALTSLGKTIVPIKLEQMNAFAGNMLEVLNGEGKPLLVMSESAFKSLNEEQIQVLSSRAQLLPVNLATIETYGGGSARCMMAEVFRPSSNPGLLRYKTKKDLIEHILKRKWTSC